MVTITLTKKEMCYCISDQLNILKVDYFPFTVELTNLMRNKLDNEDVTVSIPSEVLVFIHAGVSQYFHGMAKHINPIMLEKLKTQLAPQSNIVAVMQGLEEPDEIAAVLIAIDTKDKQDKGMIDAKVNTTKQGLGIN